VAELRDVMVYLCQNYPHTDELSNARLTKMIYLADWRSAIQRREQVTDITWFFNHYGPFVRAVLETAESDRSFTVRVATNAYGSEKSVISVSSSAEAPSVSPEDREVLDHVIRQTEALYWADFLKLVYSTYPILSQPRYTYLDLIDLAHRYAEDKEALGAGTT
jgi:hypothetical protein